MVVVVVVVRPGCGTYYGMVIDEGGGRDEQGDERDETDALRESICSWRRYIYIYIGRMHIGW